MTTESPEKNLAYWAIAGGLGGLGIALAIASLNGLGPIGTTIFSVAGIMVGAGIYLAYSKVHDANGGAAKTIISYMRFHFAKVQTFLVKNWKNTLSIFIRRQEFSSESALRSMRWDIHHASQVTFFGHMEEPALAVLVSAIAGTQAHVHIVNDNPAIYNQLDDASSSISSLLILVRNRSVVRHSYSFAKQLISFLEIQLESRTVVYWWHSERFGSSSIHYHSRWKRPSLAVPKWEQIHPVSLNSEAKGLRAITNQIAFAFSPLSLGWCEPVLPPSHDPRVAKAWQESILSWWSGSGSKLLKDCAIDRVTITWALRLSSENDAGNFREWLECLASPTGPQVKRYVFVDCDQYRRDPNYRAVVDAVETAQLRPPQELRGNEYMITYLDFNNVPTYLRGDYALMEGASSFVQSSRLFDDTNPPLLRVAISGDNHTVERVKEQLETIENLALSCGKQNLVGLVRQ